MFPLPSTRIAGVRTSSPSGRRALSYVTTHEGAEGQSVSQSTTMVRKSGSLAPCRRAPDSRSSRR